MRYGSPKRLIRRMALKCERTVIYSPLADSKKPPMILERFYCIKQIVLALARFYLVAAERFFRFGIRCMLARFWIVFAQL